jgi:hypothetical protein
MPRMLNTTVINKLKYHFHFTVNIIFRTLFRIFLVKTLLGIWREVPAFAGMTNFGGVKEIPAFAGIAMRNRMINDVAYYSIFSLYHQQTC